MISITERSFLESSLVDLLIGQNTSWKFYIKFLYAFPLDLKTLFQLRSILGLFFGVSIVIFETLQANLIKNSPAKELVGEFKFKNNCCLIINLNKFLRFYFLKYASVFESLFLLFVLLFHGLGQRFHRFLPRSLGVDFLNQNKVEPHRLHEELGFLRHVQFQFATIRVSMYDPG